MSVQVTNREATFLDVKLDTGSVGIFDPKPLALDIGLYPNPVNGQTFSITSGSEVLYYKVYSSDGRMIERESVYSSDFKVKADGLEPGVYLIYLNTMKGSTVKRFVVTR